MFLLCDATDSTSLMHYDNMTRLTVSESTQQYENLACLVTLLMSERVQACFQAGDIWNYYNTVADDGADNVPQYGNNSHTVSKADKLQEYNALMEGFVEQLSHVIEEMLKFCVAKRPLQAEAMYRRVLQVVFRTFRQGVEAMTEQTTTKVMAFLLSRGVTFSSPQFQNTFMLLIKILLRHWQYPTDQLDNIAPGMANESALTWLICLLHGIEVSNTQNVAGVALQPLEWTYTRNNIRMAGGHADMRNETRANAVIHDNLQTFLRNYIFDEQCLYCHYYNIYRLVTKPPFEMPNPVVLSSFLRDKQTTSFQTSPDAEQASDASDLHNFKIVFKKYFEEPDNSTFKGLADKMMRDIDDYFDMYNSYAPELWSSNSILAASSYMQNNATELPSFSYHGNLVCQKASGVSEEVRCVGHLGNSFPGSASIRQGKGMLNMYEKMPLPVHVM